MQTHALSVKQPWAALIVHGLKTIEIRRWSTKRRGRILIHASRVDDGRDEAWKHVPKRLREAASLQGGIIGAVELVDCITYEDVKDFQRDANLHLNEPDWFIPPILHGFRFEKPEVLPYRQCPGWFRFFKVDPPIC